MRFADLFQTDRTYSDPVGDALQTKAVANPLSPQLQAMLEQQPLVLTPDGSVHVYGLFGASYGKIYKTQSSVRAVVDFLSRNIAQCHMRLMHREPDGSSTHDEAHPVQQLLEHPQPGVPYSRWMRLIVADKAIYDVAAVLKVRENFDATPRSDGTILNQGAVTALVRIPVPYVTLEQASLTAPIRFKLTVGSRPVYLPSTDVIWMPGYAPDSNVNGIPPIETLRQILSEEWAAGKDRENHWRQGVQGSVVFVQDKDSGGLDATAARRFKKDWRNKYGGVNAPNARDWPLLPPGITPQELAIDAQQAEYLATRTLAREEACRAYGIQPQLLGITPANFASMDMYHQMLYQDTLVPWMVPLQEEFEEQLLREFESTTSGYFLDFNVNAKMQGSFLDQSRIGQQAVGGPWMTRNEFREKFQGLPPIDGGDEIIVPLNVVLAGGTQANPSDATNQFNAEILPDGVVRLTPRERETLP